ncbi:hypothetical protein [Amycolatopsis suaedae]|uniref:Uncharacterized protein n=1 Tax=Amycolatopsis suaedae TaxID=2510978 RepID=A0A4V2EM89_9PSEU|nr:hypothetical protein [Amycolatopsis suaedae]RZQ64225.1 hypothetical protein EWH70_09595 [Amycolatopsis suaedae]
MNGANVARVRALCAEMVARIGLDLRGRVVVTEAATGAYAVTPVLAQLAGAAEVRALARDSRYGTADEAQAQVVALGGTGVRFTRVKDAALFDGADVVTNSGHLRPIDARTVGWLRPGAAVSLMYEPWELRPGEVDLAACQRAGVSVAGPDEHHPDVGVFGYLGVMAVRQLLDAGIPVRGSRVLLLCDNGFLDDIGTGLRALGADVTVAERPEDGPPGRLDAVVVALHPREHYRLDHRAMVYIGQRYPGAVVTQYWGDIDRTTATPVWPPTPPEPGHMGILPSAVGADPIVALQAAGLKVGEVLTLGRPPTPEEEAFLLRVPERAVT